MKSRAMKWRLAITMALLLAAALTACGTKNRIRIGTAGEGGNYNLLGQALSNTLAGDPYKIATETKTTAGSAANIRLLSGDYLELALAQSDVTDEMYSGASGEALKGYSAVAALYPEPVQIVVRADSGISTIEDLAGKTVSIGEEDSGTEKNAAQILQAYGLTAGMLTMKNMTYAEASAALTDGSIDAMFCTAGAPAQVVTELSEKTPVNLVSIDEKRSRLLTDAYGFYSEIVIPAGTYKGQQEDVQTLSVVAVLLASDKVPEETVYKITGALFTEKDELNRSLPVIFELSEESAVKSVTIPFHKGAAKYYEEHGITVETLEK